MQCYRIFFSQPVQSQISISVSFPNLVEFKFFLLFRENAPKTFLYLLVNHLDLPQSWHISHWKPILWHQTSENLHTYKRRLNVCYFRLPRVKIDHKAQWRIFQRNLMLHFCDSGFLFVVGKNLFPNMFLWLREQRVSQICWKKKK